MPEKFIRIEYSKRVLVKKVTRYESELATHFEIESLYKRLPPVKSLKNEFDADTSNYLCSTAKPVLTL